ncbi:short-chain Z-isoprenyl diphosphate synthase [Streptomyces mashuensis]|uniref:Isoprenyl transferase n=1 Tax=Streptomyces mashuensis TaxID=33904 RepID=A0A919B7X0_9ACTN|nr:polyprenyl diphosphate synthase [Streptomyces mashuensis]GHF65245.1 short-chain Z-isoprenyl diphosphate synthase [Streptomyces mashuensis]
MSTKRSPSARTHPAVRRAAPPVPRHIGVILDGNRRWARAHQVSEDHAYRAGAARVADLMRWSEAAGIEYVTVWALSTSNLRRPEATVRLLTTVIVNGLRDLAATGRWPVRLIGDLGLLPADRADALREIEAATAGAPGPVLNAAVAYDGREDILGAVRALARDRAAGRTGEEVTEALLAGYLSTAGQPDVDLLIRTSGEQRLSGFLVWQAAEAELYFTPVPWPDFGPRDFARALAAYRRRERRFGR